MEPGTSYWTELIQRAYELQKWELQWLSKMPKSYRYGLGNQIESSGMAILTNLLDARYGFEREMAVTNALRVTNHHRYQLRLALDLALMTPAQQEHALKYLLEIGRLLASHNKKSTSDSSDAS